MYVESCDIQKNKDLHTHSTFGIPATAEAFVSVNETAKLPDVLAQAQKTGLPATVIGGGSNTVLAGTHINECVVHLQNSGITQTSRGQTVRWQIAAGEVWDDVVERSVRHNLVGIEALSAIPGSVGAAPVQNIGAYGSQLSDVLVSVKAFDRNNNKFRMLDKSECEFGYRTSRFKKEPDRFIITDVTIELQQRKPNIPDYDDVRTYFKKRSNSNPTVSEIREAIMDIRWSKLPRPKETPNVGSFFTNPIISKEKCNKLQDKYPDMPHYPQCGGRKIPAGWLIEGVGLKGTQHGTVGVSDDHALILTSNESARFEDLVNCIGTIKHRVREDFGIKLEREPRILI